MKTKKRNAIFGRYPCCDLVNNAIRFIIAGKADLAIDELYTAIRKSNGYIHEDLKDKVKESHDKVVDAHWSSFAIGDSAISNCDLKQHENIKG